MKKISKVLALISGVVMAVASFSSIHAEARIFKTDNAFETPEGYEVVEDNERYFQMFAESGDNDDYVVYRQLNNGHEYIQIYHDYRYNHTVFNVVNDKIDVYDAIYAKYSDKLNMQYYYRANPPVQQPDLDVEAVMHDAYDENGNVTNDPSKMEDKFDIIKEMTAEMYEAGCITEAVYNPVIAYVANGEKQLSAIHLNTGDLSEQEKKIEYDNIQEIVGAFDDAEITLSDDGSYYQLDVKSECFFEIASKINEIYPDAKLYSNGPVFLATESKVEGETINILSEIGDIADDGTVYGDLNFDGRIGIGDAIAINKFVNGSIILNEEQTKAADLNSDGTVNGDDLYTMLRYLVDDIDTLPLTE